MQLSVTHPPSNRAALLFLGATEPKLILERGPVVTFVTKKLAGACSHNSSRGVLKWSPTEGKRKGMLARLAPGSHGRLYIPMAEARGFTPRFGKGSTVQGLGVSSTDHN